MNTPASASFRSRLTFAHGRIVVAAALMLAATLIGVVATARALAVFGNTSWLFDRPWRIASVTSIVAPAFIMCGLFVFASRLLCAATGRTFNSLTRSSVAAIFIALYAPFCWLGFGSWPLSLPLLPGFSVGFFTHQLDSTFAFVTASGACTATLITALCVVRYRHRNGHLIAPSMAFTISTITSYAVYSVMSV